MLMVRVVRGAICETMQLIATIFHHANEPNDRRNPQGRFYLDWSIIMAIALRIVAGGTCAAMPRGLPRSCMMSTKDRPPHFQVSILEILWLVELGVY